MRGDFVPETKLAACGEGLRRESFITRTVQDVEVHRFMLFFYKVNIFPWPAESFQVCLSGVRQQFSELEHDVILGLLEMLEENR
jgi:hypothetical protein